jgi:hypothetical protein
MLMPVVECFLGVLVAAAPHGARAALERLTVVGAADAHAERVRAFGLVAISMTWLGEVLRDATLRNPGVLPPANVVDDFEALMSNEDAHDAAAFAFGLARLAEHAGDACLQRMADAVGSAALAAGAADWSRVGQQAANALLIRVRPDALASSAETALREIQSA